MTTVSVVVPCYPPHFHFLPRLLHNLQAQTYYPNEIILALSECSRERARELYQELRPLARCPLRLAITTQKCYAGLNRNRGAAQATSTYVAFLDADDLYHPQKLELGRTALDLSGADVALHSYHHRQAPKDFNDRRYSLPKLTASNDIYRQTFGTPARRDRLGERNDITNIGLRVGYKVHHGLPMVRREIMELVPYTDMPRGQDCYFLRDAMFDYGLQIVAMPIPLVHYLPSGN